MQVRDARTIAEDWIQESGQSIPGYQGAYLAGSICWLAEDDELPAFSDIDLHIVVDDDHMTAKPGKFQYLGSLLEVSLEPTVLFDDPVNLLKNAAIGASVARNQLLDDPTGSLAPTFNTVARAFPERAHVIERINVLERSIRTAMVDIDESAKFHDQAMWIFPAGLTTHMILVAGLGNPTVRRRFVEVGKMLEAYGESETLDHHLALIGCDRITVDQAQHHLNALIPVYDATSQITQSTSRFVSDVSANARSISIDGTGDLIDNGYHREAMFWIVATFARCLNVIVASDDHTIFPSADKAFRSVMKDVGINGVADIRSKATAVIAALPQIRAVANRIVEGNPDIVSASQDH